MFQNSSVFTSVAPVLTCLSSAVGCLLAGPFGVLTGISDAEMTPGIWLTVESPTNDSVDEQHCMKPTDTNMELWYCRRFDKETYDSTVQRLSTEAMGTAIFMAERRDPPSLNAGYRSPFKEVMENASRNPDDILSVYHLSGEGRRVLQGCLEGGYSYKLAKEKLASKNGLTEKDIMILGQLNSAEAVPSNQPPRKYPNPNPVTTAQHRARSVAGLSQARGSVAPANPFMAAPLFSLQAPPSARDYYGIDLDKEESRVAELCHGFGSTTPTSLYQREMIKLPDHSRGRVAMATGVAIAKDATGKWEARCVEECDHTP